MKRPQKPTRKQKIFISSRHFNPANWFVAGELEDKLVLRHRHTNTLLEMVKAR